jgi:BirA family biotin operon repressor/biotin-[acetyl-CoA-carboxylase] ligase
MLEEWKAFNNTLGFPVRIIEGDKEIRGIALGLDEEGFLLIKDTAGEVHKIVCGDVSLRQE